MKRFLMALMVITLLTFMAGVASAEGFIIPTPTSYITGK
jgi:hypothetical protein